MPDVSSSLPAEAPREIPEPEVRVTRYEVSCLPEGHEVARHMTVAVEYRSRGKWAVLDAPYCLSISGEWDYEMRPSEREDDWLDAHRFDLDTALKLAREAAPKMTVNGWTVDKVLAGREARNA